MDGAELGFTGNWFIDAGILGFVNLMEEVYGWDLEELQKRIREEPEKVYYGYFPLAYLFYHSIYHKYIKNTQTLNAERSEAKKKLQETEGLLRDLEKELLESTEKERKKLKKKIEKTQKKAEKLRGRIEESLSMLDKEKNILEREKKRLQETSLLLVERTLSDASNNFENIYDDISQAIGHYELQLPKDHRNFFLYNPKKEPGIAFQYLYWLLRRDYEKLKELKRGKPPTYERVPDSTINPFLYSPVEFPNVSYTKPLTVEQITEILPAEIPAYVVFLSFFNAFQWILGSYAMIYTSDLQSSYSINKRLKLHIQSSQRGTGLFKLMWSAIIDEIVETKARFSLENLYIIEFENIENQKLKSVEYIGIPKLHASIILDDNIRDALNTPLTLRDSQIWLLGEFIKQRALYPLIAKHIWSAMKRGYLNWRASLYALAVDAKLKQVPGQKEVFGRAFLERPSRAVTEIKGFYMDMVFTASQSKGLSTELNGKNIAYLLLSAIRRHNRNAFVNILLKALLHAKSRDNVASLNSYIFRRILTNDSSWENFALAVVIGLMGGGENVTSKREDEGD